MGAQGSQSGIAFIEEVEWGVNPTGQMTGVNFTAEDMKLDIENQVSNNVRPDRQTADLVQVGAECGGGFETEFQADNLDALLPGFFMDGTWTAPPPGENVVFIAETVLGEGGLLVVGDSSLYHPGQLLKISGSTLNDGWIQVRDLENATHVITVEPLVDEPSAAVTYEGEYVRNGVTRHSFTIERANYDVGQFFLYTGMTPNTMEMAIESGSPITCNLNFVGKSEHLQQTPNNTPAPTSLVLTPIMNAVSSVGEITIDGEVMEACLLQKIDLTLDNQVDGKTGVGVLGFCDADAKSLAVTGNISMYFNDETYYEKYLESTQFGITINMIDTAGNTYVLDLPACKFDSAAANVSGKDEDVMVEGTFVAIASKTTGYTIQLTRILV